MILYYSGNTGLRKAGQGEMPERGGRAFMLSYDSVRRDFYDAAKRFSWVRSERERQRTDIGAVPEAAAPEAV